MSFKALHEVIGIDYGARKLAEDVRVGLDLPVEVARKTSEIVQRAPQILEQRSQIRIGVNAPKHVPVHREELYQRIQRERQNQHEPRIGPVSDFERRYRVNRVSADAPLSTARR